jgi:hypothetical protein
LAAGRFGTAGFTAGWLGTAGLAVGALGCAGLDVEVDVPVVAGVVLDCPCHRATPSTTKTAITAVPITTAQIRNQDGLVACRPVFCGPLVCGLVAGWSGA